MQREPISIFGDTIAGLSAAQILSRLGHPVAILTGGHSVSRQVALNGASLFLIERIWGRDLLDGAVAHALERRILLWEGREPIVLAERALVVDVVDLAARMKSLLTQNKHLSWDDAHACEEPDIVAATYENRDRYLTGGTRVAVQAQVLLRDGAAADALHVEAIASGWLALLPIDDGKAMLMGVALDTKSEIDFLLDESKHTRRAVTEICPSFAPSNAAPRLFVSATSARAAMRIGGTAMRFDPISGDGVAGALRGAHLAALLLDQRAREGKRFDTAAIYGQRLARAMRAHLGGLSRLYGAAPMANSWSSELEAMRTMDFCVAELWPAEEPKVAIKENVLTAL